MRAQAGGVVLCGGQSSRMGRPKAWLPFDGELMLPRVVRILREVVEPVIVVAARDQNLPPLPEEVEIVRDEEEGRGPLQGLAAGLDALHGKTDAAFVSACDVPLLKSAFIRRMIDRLGENFIAVPRVDGLLHPLAAVYRVAVLPHVRALLTADRRRTALLFDAVPTRFVEKEELAEVDPELESLRNLNYPADYELALRKEDDERTS